MHADKIRETIWTTSAKQKIRVRDMTDTHLRHAINFINRDNPIGSDNISKLSYDGWVSLFRYEQRCRKSENYEIF